MHSTPPHEPIDEAAKTPGSEGAPEDSSPGEGAESRGTRHAESALNLAAPSRLLSWADDTDTVVEWPTYTVDDLPAIEGQLPYPVDIYPSQGTKGMGLAGRLPTRGAFEHLPVNPAPQQGIWWDDDCACFRPSTVVWNGVATGGVLHPEEGDGHWRRLYDGTLMGSWPLNPPREAKPHDPLKARLAALEAQG